MTLRTSCRPCFAVFFLTLVLLAGNALAAPPNPNYNFCWNKCQPGVSCTTSCDGLFGPTTCGAYNGAPANDLDSDGVANASDNCVCVANANQANCDGDASGDVCDSRNELWVLVSDLGACEWDSKVDFEGLEYDLKLYGARRYRNVCNNAYCSDKYVIQNASCNFSLSGCGSSSGSCCQCSFEAWCTPTILCGSPDCPF